MTDRVRVIEKNLNPYAGTNSVTVELSPFNVGGISLEIVRRDWNKQMLDNLRVVDFEQHLANLLITWCHKHRQMKGITFGQALDTFNKLPVNDRAGIIVAVLEFECDVD